MKVKEIVAWSMAATYEEFFSWAVATIALWKSAPIDRNLEGRQLCSQQNIMSTLESTEQTAEMREFYTVPSYITLY